MDRLMKILSLALPLSLALTPAPGEAAEALVKITAPAEGAKLDSMALTKLVYEVRPGPKGDHVHVYVDGKEVGILRQLKGSYTLEALAPGSRSICVKVVNKAHVPIGVEQCVKVAVE
ncbi:MAG: hypothetical protein OEZ08_08335 [Betaproteobacteria bacterium]|nr:hypothetical protein [Betaproteobacteria bacterium]